jgi:hypothetical protein
VFFSCVLQGKMSGLHNAYAVRRWLTRPIENWEMLRRSLDLLKSEKAAADTQGTKLDSRDTVPPKDIKSTSENIIAMQEQLATFRQKLNKLYHRPSLSAALIITAPSQLLNVALGSLLIGFGIYYGIVYTSRLPAIEDHHSAFAVLIVYVVSVASGLFLFYWPMLFKELATMRDGERVDLQASVAGLESALDTAMAAKLDAETPKPDDTLLALNRIIHIQDEQLRLQREFMAVLGDRFGPAAGPVDT